MPKASEIQKQRMREYHQRMKGNLEYVARRKEEAIRNKETKLKWHRKSRESPEGWAKHQVRMIRHRAKKSGMDFDISYEDILFPDICPVLGIPLSPGVYGKRLLQSPNSPSVDRFDNTKGYVKGNVRVISLRANLLKRDATLEEMKRIVRYMEGVL